MDARKFASKYINADSVRESPVTARIVNVFEDDRYGRLTLELETGSEFSLNQGNANVLIHAWGHETDNWMEQELELSLGFYKDWKVDPPVDKETVKVRAISPAKTTTANGGESGRPVLPPSRTVAAKKDEMDDQIPF